MVLDRVPLASAVQMIQGKRPKAAPVSIIRAIVGRAAVGAMPIYAGQFWEEARPLESGDCGGITIEHDPALPVRLDFWSAEVVEWLAAGDNWKTNNIERQAALLDFDLPPRFFKSNATTGQFMALRQIALGVNLPSAGIAELIVSDDWTPWVRALSARRKSGPGQKWKWDHVKVELTIAAATNPTVLSSQQSIVEFMQEAFEKYPPFGDNLAPDLAHIRAYAALIIAGISITTGNPETAPI